MKAKRRITALRIDEGSAVDKPANPGARIVLFKRESGGASAVTDNKESIMAEVKKARSPEEIMAALPPEDKEVLEMAVKAAIAQAVEQAKAAPPPAEEPPAPSPEDEAKAAVAKAYDEKMAVLQKRIDELETERKRGEAIAKAQSYGVPGATVDQIADVLIALDGNAAALSLLDGVLKSARAVHDASGITTEIGKRGDDNSPDAYAQLKAVAAELQKSAGLTEAQAITKAAEVRPDLAAKCL